MVLAVERGIVIRGLGLFVGCVERGCRTGGGDGGVEVCRGEVFTTTLSPYHSCTGVELVVLPGRNFRRFLG